MPRVLVVDRNRTVLYSVRQALVHLDAHVSTAGSLRRAITLAREAPPDLIVADVQLAEDGLWDMLAAKGALGRSRIIATVSDATPRAMLSAARRGAVEVLVKPLDYQRLRELVSRLLQPPAEGLGNVGQLPAGLSLVAESAAMHEVLRDVGRAASGSFTVLFTGEPGVGKTHLARVVQRHGLRAGAAYAEIELAGKTTDRVLYELFGHERGAFSKAQERRLGRIERCQGGTVLLEQVDHLPRQAQSRLLSLFEEGLLRRLGSDVAYTADVQILATADRDFERRVAAGVFRADLYHGLREFTIALPPLRERLDELPQLAAWFLFQGATRPGSRATSISTEALSALRRYAWPGNLWELESVLRAASWRCQAGAITVDDLPEGLRPARTASVSGVELQPPGMEALEAFLHQALTTNAQDVYPAAVAHFDRYICGRVLRHTQGNQSRAARILGMTRRSLRTKVRRFDLAHTVGSKRPGRR
ncbi:MAG TPA: sigma 54-interacting transcriptional regulator [Pirellulales bacterium]|nr:sigma 54-interacting transcriptional regulator [Pirellulales bacterium]